MTQEMEPVAKKRRIDESVEDDGDSQSEHRPLGEWECSANDAICLKLVHAANVKDDSAVFHPEFTYPVFGMDEVIQGYKDLRIKMFYAAGSLFTYLDVSYGQKRGLGDTRMSEQPDDVVDLLSNKIPSDYTRSYDEYLRRVQADEQMFKPMGEKLHQYSSADGQPVYEVYKCTFDTPRFREYHRRLQVFLLWYIEGASFLEESDDRWEFLLLFQRRIVNGNDAYFIIGYMSYYPFFHYSPNNCDKRRIRISQFLILPPYQRQRHGERLYQFAYQHFASRSEVVEITVEDPNDDFQDLRDKCDLRYLLEQKAFGGLTLPVAPQISRELAVKFKLSKRQLERCMEMFFLRNLDAKDKKAYHEYRMQVKRRIYKQNEDVLSPLPKDDQTNKLRETYEMVEAEYRRILEKLTN